MGDEGERGFTVVDKRGSAGGDEADEAVPAGANARPGELPRVDFATFCLSLGTSALYHLGVMGDPSTGEKAERPDPTLARQTIDALEMLKEKTRGNLDAEEEKLLGGLLYELHMRFVEATKEPGSGE